jgi:DNA-binding PadR family transcriptional regulator
MPFDPKRDPLDPKTFQILLSLAAEQRHGYAIRQEVEQRTQGAVRLWPATLYGILAGLAERGLIEETEGPGGEEDDTRRRYYLLTPAGRGALAREAARLEHLVQLARSRLALKEGT